MNQYFGTYHRFETASKKEAGRLLGADNLVGDLYHIDCTMEGTAHKRSEERRVGKECGS